MSSPAVSICTPAFKADRYLLETLESVRAQTFTNWELIVTEDGSRDRTEEIVRDFAKTVSQPVTYHRHDPNRGLPATRNHGISIANAPWIALLDSDDLWTSDHLASTMALVAQNNADLIHGGSQLFDSDTGRDSELRVPSADEQKTFPLSLFLAQYVIQPSSVLLRKELWSRVNGFNPDFRYVEDREMWLRCARAGGRFAYTGKVTCRYRKHGAALSKHAGPMAVASAKVLEQHVDWTALPETVRREETSTGWMSAGRILLREDPRTAADYFSRASRHKPFSPKIWSYRAAALACGLLKRKSA